MQRRKRFLNVAAVLVGLSLILSACSGSGKKLDVIKLGSLTWNEPAIVMEMVSLLIKQELPNQKVEHVKNLASTSVVQTAFDKGDIQIYLSWTGTEWTGPMRQTVTDELRKDPRKIFEAVRDYAKKTWNAVVPEPLGYENTYALVMRRDKAQQLGIKTVSDLAAKAKDMTIATDQDFSIRQGDGLADFQKWYNVSFKKSVPMDVGLMYRAAAEGLADVAMAYSTDGRIKQLDLVVIKDDKHFFPPYDGMIIIHPKVITALPQLEGVIKQLSGKISTEEMIDMNYRADVKGEDITAVARTFLQGKGLLKK